MNRNQFDRLSVEQRETVHSALAAVFGSAPISAAVPLVGGISAFVFRVQIGGRSYLLRLEGAASPLRNPHQYTSMQIAASAGIAPRIHYVDEVARIVIMDFIEQRPLRTYPGGARGLARALGDLLARLQASPVFPYFVEYPDIVARLFAHVRRTGLFASGLLDPHVERLEELRVSYVAGSTQVVSSHNDFHQGNILFDGERLWLIDWESAYCNDPLVDVAIVLDSLSLSEESESILLNAWLGHTPDRSTRTRLELIRALTRLYFAGVFLSASAAASCTKADGDLGVPDPEGFRRAIKEGRIEAGTPQANHILGKIFLASFLSGASVPSFGGVN